MQFDLNSEKTDLNVGQYLVAQSEPKSAENIPQPATLPRVENVPAPHIPLYKYKKNLL